MQELISAQRIQGRVAELAEEIAQHYQGRPVLFIGVLTGCLIFLADLVRRVQLPLQIHLVQASSYRGETTLPGQLRLRLDTLPDLAGREVLVVDDILDTAQTLARLVDELLRRGAVSVRVCVLLRKHGRQQVPLEPDHTGFDIPDAFVVGYGLDFNDEYRHLPYVGVLPGSAGGPA
jgi:hypoxanthine phosphoribosyltransferase